MSEKIERKFCVIKTEFGKDEFAKLNDFMFYLANEKNSCNFNDYCLFYADENGFEFKEKYNDFISKGQIDKDGPFDNKLQIDVSAREYINRENITDFIVEIECETNPNEVYLQYLLCTLQYALLKKNNLFFFFYRTSKDKEKIYEPFVYDSKFRLFLSCFCKYYVGLEDYFYYYSKYSGKKDNGEKGKEDKVTKIITLKNKVAQNGIQYVNNKYKNIIKYVGRLLPTIPINEITYKELLSGFSKIESNRSDCEELYYAYKNRIQRYPSKRYLKLKDEILNWIEKYSDSDNVLDGLIFISTLWFMYFENNEIKKCTEKVIELLHEICCDYSQGVSQLIENAYYHVVKVSNNSKDCGCANFTIRIRKKVEKKGKEDDLSKHIDPWPDYPEKFKNKISKTVEYFMESYITDLQFGTFQGVKQKFVENAKKIIKNSKLSISEKEIEDIKLQSLFTGEGDVLNKYLSQPSNVAFHYGLQILNNTIDVANGYLDVISGGEYSNQDELLSIDPTETRQITMFDDNQQKKLSFEWKNGTAYTIYLPIEPKNTKNYLDTIASNVNIETNEIDNIEIILNWGQIKVDWEKKIKEVCESDSADGKKRLVFIIKNEMSRQIGNSNKIYFIDCSNVELKDYEPLARAVFLAIVQPDGIEELNNIALINLANRHEVVKLFRQFALFYNRKGKNKCMENNKSVFLVDKNAELDIFLQDKISKMKEWCCESQINGGHDEPTIEIVKHLAARGEKNGK